MLPPGKTLSLYKSAGSAKGKNAEKRPYFPVLRILRTPKSIK